MLSEKILLSSRKPDVAGQALEDKVRGRERGRSFKQTACGLSRCRIRKAKTKSGDCLVASVCPGGAGTGLAGGGCCCWVGSAASRRGQSPVPSPGWPASCLGSHQVQRLGATDGEKGPVFRGRQMAFCVVLEDVPARLSVAGRPGPLLTTLPAGISPRIPLCPLLSPKLEALWRPPLPPGKKSSSEVAAWSWQEASWVQA